MFFDKPPHSQMTAPRLEVVGAQAFRAADDDLCALAVRDDDRRGPRGDLVAFDFPAFLARALVESDEEGLPLVVPVDDQRVAVQGGRAALAVRVLDPHVAQVGLPHQEALQVEGVESARAEEREHVLAVRHGRARGEAGREVRAFVRQLLARRTLPQDLARGAAERQHAEALATRDRRIVVRAGRQVRRRFELVTDGDRRRQEQALAPDHRRRVTAAGKGDLPAHVLILAPGHGRIGVGREPGRERAAPRRPVVLGSERRLGLLDGSGVVPLLRRGRQERDVKKQSESTHRSAKER